MFVTEPTTLVDADTGDILAIYEELPINTDDVLKALNAIRYDTYQRTGGLKTTSRIFGYSPRITMRKDFCSSASLAAESPKEHQMVCDLGIQIEDFYRNYNPDGYKRHKELSTSKKTTCLWLKGLPNLVPTQIVEPEIITLSNGKKFSADYMRGVKRSKAGESSVERSKTYTGIAKAMAEQWAGNA